jgi:peptidoglycan hydrolase CwlO-like protein
LIEEKTEIPGLIRASKGVLINKDNEALAAYKKRKRKERQVDEMQADIDTLKSDIQEIKELLKKALT